MLIVPELVPVDFRLRRVEEKYVSSQIFDPYAEPRITHPSIAKYLSPIRNVKGEYAITKVSDVILDNWCNDMRAYWVSEPGKDAKNMDRMYRKYSKPHGDLDPRYKSRASIFPRSYKQELDCFEDRRLQMVANKMNYDDLLETDPQSACMCLESDTVENRKKSSALRWQERPKLFAESQTDPCIRRAEFGLYGLPFRNAACAFYNKNYPSPKLEFRFERFSK